MDAIYYVKADELDQRFLDALKAMFKDKEIEITIYVDTTKIRVSPALSCK